MGLKGLFLRSTSTQRAGHEGQAYGYLHWCPGCDQAHHIPVYLAAENGCKWGFNENFEKPSFTPSINIVGQCHYFITDGMIQFCGDSKHHLANQTVPLPVWDEGEWDRV